nr:anti-sigma factor [Microlunatus antarcticus]
MSDEQLAALAADADHRATPDELDHLGSCASCSRELGALSDLARDARAVRPSDLRPPRPEVWAAVERDLAGDEPVAAPPRPASSRPASRRRGALVAVAAVSGLVVGVGGTLGVLALRSSDEPVAGPALVASTVLAPLPGETGEGTAELVRDRDTLQLRVHATLTSSPTRDYHEVWLINSDGRRMYALGVLPSSGDASYWLPTPTDDRLDGYQTVDISLEPEDGDAAHSQHSLVRGRLPG